MLDLSTSVPQTSCLRASRKAFSSNLAAVRRTPDTSRVMLPGTESLGRSFAKSSSNPGAASTGKGFQNGTHGIRRPKSLTRRQYNEMAHTPQRCIATAYRNRQCLLYVHIEFAGGGAAARRGSKQLLAPWRSRLPNSPMVRWSHAPRAATWSAFRKLAAITSVERP